MTSPKDNTTQQDQREIEAYEKPALEKAGSLAELTQGFSGSIPDENGGHTKRNPFAG